MSFSSDLKIEIITKKIKKPCCKVAALSAFIRTNGSVITRGEMIGFTYLCESEVAEYFSKVIESIYSEKCIKNEEKNGKTEITVLSESSSKILVDAKIIDITVDGFNVLLDISDSLLKDKCCADAYITGAFLGAGSITVPTMDKDKTTGYHLEFVFSKYVTASGFADLLSSKGFFPKTVERKDNYVVYFKNAEEIGDLIGLFGANKSFLKFTDIIITKEVRNEMNRKQNCEMSNMTKRIDAFLKTRDEIELIEQSVGLDALGENLKRVCTARLEYEDKSLSELADILGITKSCLNHRLRKISEIAKNLK